MKKFSFFWMAALALVVGGALVACSQDESLGTDPEPDFYTVKLGWGGEIVDIAYEPLDTRATTDDLYGIQVYSKPNNNSTATSWEPYAYGLFDDPTNISIDLASGNKYKFVATMIVDGKNKIGIEGEGEFDESNYYYHMPFWGFTLDKVGTFVYDNSEGLEDLGNSYTALRNQSSCYSIPNTDRYYGELTDFVPSSSNANAAISMKRVSFGAKFIAEGALAKSGTLAIQITDAPKMSLALTEGDDSISDIFTFRNIEGAWSNYDGVNDYSDGYYENMSVSFKWIRPDETELQIGTFPITFKRNTTTVVTVKMENDVVVGDIEGGVGFSIANTEKGEMPVDEDNSVTITDGEVETEE